MRSTHGGNVAVCSNAKIFEGLVHVRWLLLIQQLQANNHNTHIKETNQRIKLNIVRFVRNPHSVVVLGDTRIALHIAIPFPLITI